MVTDPGTEGTGSVDAFALTDTAAGCAVDGMAGARRDGFAKGLCGGAVEGAAVRRGAGGGTVTTFDSSVRCQNFFRIPSMFTSQLVQIVIASIAGLLKTSLHAA
jgi:hypothetical protein